MNKQTIQNIFRSGILFSLATGAAQAVTTTYTDQSAFFTALSGSVNTLDFESITSGTTFSSGSTLNGITFNYDFGGGSLAVTDGDQFGGGGPFDTTSGSGFLGTDNSDLLIDDDDFSLDLLATNAIGFSVITAEAPNISLFDDDIQLTASGITALLDVDNVQQTLADGSLVFFIGIINDSASFTTASVDTPNSSGAFFYNIDDIVTTSAVPVPAAFWLFGSGLVGLISFSKRNTKQKSLL